MIIITVLSVMSFFSIELPSLISIPQRGTLLHFFRGHQASLKAVPHNAARRRHFPLGIIQKLGGN
jgi:hypothetical protein